MGFQRQRDDLRGRGNSPREILGTEDHRLLFGALT